MGVLLNPLHSDLTVSTSREKHFAALALPIAGATKSKNLSSLERWSNARLLLKVIVATRPLSRFFAMPLKGLAGSRLEVEDQ